MALNADFFVKMPISQKLLILATIIVLIVLGYWFGIDSGKQKALKDKFCQKTDLEFKKRQLEDIEKKKDQMVKYNNFLKDRINQLKKLLPSELKDEELLTSFIELAAGRGISLTSIKPPKNKDGNPKESYIEWPIELKMEGEYKKLLDFFYYVTSKQERIITFSDLELKVGGKGSGAKVAVTCQATAYKFKEEGKPQATTPQQEKAKGGAKKPAPPGKPAAGGEEKAGAGEKK